MVATRLWRLKDKATNLLRSAAAAPRTSLLRSGIAAPVLLLAQASLRLTDVARTRSWLLWDVPQGTSEDPDLARPVAKSVTRVSRRRPLSWFGIDCLAESLVIESWLARRGFRTELRIGISPTRRSDAHAWVEVGGQPVNEADDIADRMPPFAESVPRPSR